MVPAQHCQKAQSMEGALPLPEVGLGRQLPHIRVCKFCVNLRTMVCVCRASLTATDRFAGSMQIANAVPPPLAGLPTRSGRREAIDGHALSVLLLPAAPVIFGLVLVHDVISTALAGFCGAENAPGLNVKFDYFFHLFFLSGDEQLSTIRIYCHGTISVQQFKSPLATRSYGFLSLNC